MLVKTFKNIAALYLAETKAVPTAILKLMVLDRATCIAGDMHCSKCNAVLEVKCLNFTSVTLSKLGHDNTDVTLTLILTGDMKSTVLKSTTF